MPEINFNQIKNIKDRINEIEKELSKMLIENSRNKTKKEEIEKARLEKVRLERLKEELLSKPLSIHQAKKIIPLFSKKIFSEKIQNYFYPSKIKRKIRKIYQNNSAVLNTSLYILIGFLTFLLKIPFSPAIAIFLMIIGTVSIVNPNIRLTKLILGKHFEKEDEEVLEYLKNKKIKSKAIDIIDSKIMQKEETLSQAPNIEASNEDYFLELQIEKASLNQEYNEIMNSIIRSKEEKGNQKTLRRK